MPLAGVKFALAKDAVAVSKELGYSIIKAAAVTTVRCYGALPTTGSRRVKALRDPVKRTSYLIGNCTFPLMVNVPVAVTP